MSSGSIDLGSNGSSGAGVNSLNSLTGSLSLISSDSTVQITPSGANINLSATGNGSFQFTTSSPGGFKNVGLGGPASAADGFPILSQRTLASPVIEQLSNPSTAAGAGVKYQLVADNGNNTGEMGLFTSTTSAPDAYSGGRMTVRATDSCPGISLIADGSGSATIKVYAGGNGASNNVFNLSATAATFLNLQYLTLPTGTSDPTAPEGSMYYNTSTHTIKVYNGTAWKTVTMT